MAGADAPKRAVRGDWILVPGVCALAVRQRVQVCLLMER